MRWGKDGIRLMEGCEIKVLSGMPMVTSSLLPMVLPYRRGWSSWPMVPTVALRKSGRHRSGEGTLLRRCTPTMKGGRNSRRQLYRTAFSRISCQDISGYSHCRMVVPTWGWASVQTTLPKADQPAQRVTGVDKTLSATAGDSKMPGSPTRSGAMGCHWGPKRPLPAIITSSWAMLPA